MLTVALLSLKLVAGHTGEPGETRLQETNM